MSSSLFRAPITSSSIAIGSPISGGTDKEILYIDSTGKLAQSSNLVFDGSNLNVGGNIFALDNLDLGSDSIPDITGGYAVQSQGLNFRYVGTQYNGIGGNGLFNNSHPSLGLNGGIMENANQNLSDFAWACLDPHGGSWYSAVRLETRPGYVLTQQVSSGPGTITDDGSGNITGSGTTFTASFQVGYSIQSNDSGIYAVVTGISDDTDMTVSVPTGAAGGGYNIIVGNKELQMGYTDNYIGGFGFQPCLLLGGWYSSSARAFSVGGGGTIVPPNDGLYVNGPSTLDAGSIATDGSGNVTFNGTIMTQGYQSADGSNGDTTTVTTSLLVGKTMTFKNGLLVSFA